MWRKTKWLFLLKFLLLLIFITTQSRRCRPQLPPASVEKDVTLTVSNFMGNCRIATNTSITNNNVNYVATIRVEYGNDQAGNSFYEKSSITLPSQSVSSFSRVIKVATNLPVRVTVIIDASDCSLCPATTCPNFNAQQSPGFTNSAGRPYWRAQRLFTTGETTSISTFGMEPTTFPRILQPVITAGVPEFCTRTVRNQ